MNSNTPLPIDPETFEAFLDGRLTGAEAASVEAAIRSDPVLAAEADAQRRINESLRRHFAPVAVECPAPAPIPISFARPVARRLSWFALAAAVVLSVSGAAWYAFGRVDTGPEALYHRLAAANFKPDWKCSTDQEFVDFQRYRLGEAFLVHADAAVALIGWSYSRDTLSPQAEALMATVDGEHSVVLVDRLMHDKPLKARPGSGLNLFRREMGTLVLYEITPLAKPRLLDLAYPAPTPTDEHPQPIP